MIEINHKNNFIFLNNQIINMKNVDHIYINVIPTVDEKKYFVSIDFSNKTNSRHFFESLEKCEEVVKRIYELLGDYQNAS